MRRVDVGASGAAPPAVPGVPGRGVRFCAPPPPPKLEKRERVDRASSKAAMAADAAASASFVRGVLATGGGAGAGAPWSTGRGVLPGGPGMSAAFGVGAILMWSSRMSRSRGERDTDDAEDGGRPPPGPVSPRVGVADLGSLGEGLCSTMVRGVMGPSEAIGVVGGSGEGLQSTTVPLGLAAEGERCRMRPDATPCPLMASCQWEGRVECSSARADPQHH